MQILSRREMKELVRREPHQYSVVGICEWGMRKDMDDIEDLCDLLVLDFNDATFEGRESCPSREHVEQALNWARTRDIDRMIVSCAAGISRSSATAFLILCERSSPEEAQTIWELGHHSPNELILHYGVQILGEHLRPVIKDYIQKDATFQGLRLEWITKYFK